MRKITKQMVAFLMIFAMLSSMLTGCKKETTTSQADAITSIVEEAMKEALISGDVGLESDNKTYNAEQEIQVEKSAWNDENDAESDIKEFVYYTITDELALYYEIFSGSILLSDGEEVKGTAYTDYAALYRDEETGKDYFPCGFVPYPGERTLTEEEIRSGLIVTEVSMKESEWDYVLQYIREPFQKHCVVYDRYVTYGINENGEVIYTVEEFSKDNVDESIGSLYSYDEEKFLLDMEVGEYTAITGTSLSELMDFSALSAEVNRILEEQDYNFSEVELKTYIYQSQEAVNAYLLSLEKESFLGHNVDELLELLKVQDTESGLVYDENGMPYIEMACVPPEDTVGFVKWLTDLMVGVAMIVNATLEDTELPLAADVRGQILICSISNFAIVAALTPYTPFIVSAVFEAVLTLINEAFSVDGFNEYTWLKVITSAVYGAVAAYFTALASIFIPGCSTAIYNIVDATVNAFVETVRVHLENGQWSGFGKTFILNVGLGILIGRGLELLMDFAKIAKPMLKEAAGMVKPMFEETAEVVKGVWKIGGRKLRSTMYDLKNFAAPFTQKVLGKVIVFNRLLGEIDFVDLPEHVKKSLLEYIDCGWKMKSDATPGTSAGKIFRNVVGDMGDETRTRALPKLKSGEKYKEYDVNNKIGKTRDAERFVVKYDKEGNVRDIFYTNNHYYSMLKVKDILRQ